MGHTHAATHRNVPADDIGAAVRDRDVAEIVREHVDIVRRGDRDDNLEFARQIGLAVDRLDDLALSTGDPLTIVPDLPGGGRGRVAMRGYWPRPFNGAR